MKNTQLYLILIVIILSSCNKSKDCYQCIIKIETESNIASNYLFIAPNVIFPEDPENSFIISLNDLQDTILDISVLIKSQKAEVLFQNQTIDFLQQSGKIEIWDGYQDSILYEGLFYFSVTVNLSNSKFLSFDGYMNSVLCDTYNKVLVDKLDCDIEDCRYPSIMFGNELFGSLCD